MGRSKNACLNILTCAGAGGGGGDVAADPTNSAAAANDCHCEESKVLSDKSRWSFRRRSTRHRVLRNNESTEVETVTNNKENPNADPINDSSNNFCSPKYSSATDKTVEQEKPKEHNIVVKEIDEKPRESDIVIKESVKETHEELKENLVVEEREEKPEEDVVVKDVEMNLEQDNLTASEEVANIPEQKENLEQAAVVIQSGFRGYTARKETVVLKNVVKIQAVARGFLVRSQAVGTLRCLLAIIKMQVVVRSRQTPKKSDITGIQGSGGAFSQGNKTCTSNDNLLLNGFACKILDTMPKTKAIHIKCDPYKPDSTWQWLERWTYTVTPSNGSLLPDQKEIIESETLTIESNAEDSHADCTLPSDAPTSDSNCNSHDEIEKLEDGFGTAAIPKEEPEMKLAENGIHACELEEEQSNLSPKIEIIHENNSSCEIPELDDVTETKSEENDMQKSSNKKATNPNFVAAKMKFQELSSNSNLSVGRSISSNSKSFTFPLQADDALSKNDNNIKNHETNYITVGGALIKAVSECGTEISISSTLDSPDRSEIEGGEIVLEIGALETKNYQKHTDSVVTETQIEAETKNPDLEFPPEPTKEQKETKTDSINTATKSVETESLLRSPEVTTTVTDVYGTPSSQNSVNTKTTKRERKKKKPSSISTKRSLNSPISDASNNNNGVIKRHGSMGHGGDTEPRISNSSLPSYMQATESARAKLHPSVSPKLSPDVSETNGSGKKRHSLPIVGTGGAGAKDSSPRMQRSQSHQAEANAKGNGTQSLGSADKRWQI